MRVLYIASNPLEYADLELSREITELQQKFLDPGGDPVSFAFQPDIKVEELPNCLARIEPDILHITVHGEKDVLHLSAGSNETVELTAQMLHAFLPISKPPQVIFLNACNSMCIAHSLAEDFGVPIAVGTSAPIKNWVARGAARNFYERLLSGMTVGQAFTTCQQMARALSRGQVNMEIYSPKEMPFPEKTVLRRTPTLVADFADANKLQGRDFILGIAGCPADTNQIVFCTDDESYLDPSNSLEDDLCLVVRGKSVDRMLWANDDNFWPAEGDVQLFATCITASGKCYSVTSFLSDALENRYRLAVGKVPDEVLAATARLREYSGAKLRPAYPPQPKSPPVRKS